MRSYIVKLAASKKKDDDRPSVASDTLKYGLSGALVGPLGTAAVRHFSENEDLRRLDDHLVSQAYGYGHAVPVALASQFVTPSLYGRAALSAAAYGYGQARYNKHKRDMLDNHKKGKR